MKNRSKMILSTLAIAIISTPLVIGVSQATERWSGYHSGYSGSGMMGGHHGKSMAKRIKEIDSNDDQAISMEEVQAWQSKKITNFDKNGNKSIDLNEFQNLWLNHKRDEMVDRFQNFDEDGDGLVTLDELSAPLNNMFSRLDKNDDKVISKDEMAKMKRHHKKYRENDDDDDD